MSRTFDLYCHDCNDALWVGQRDYIYTTPEHLSDLKRYLFAHQMHRLAFGEDQKLPEYGSSTRQYESDLDDD